MKVESNQHVSNGFIAMRLIIYLLTIMRCQDRKCGHSVDQNGLREFGCQALHEERDSSFCFATGGEELSLRLLVSWGREERRRTEAPPASRTGIDLVVKQVLDVIDR